MVNEEFLADSECRNCQTGSDDELTRPVREPRDLSLKDLWRKSSNGTLDRLSPAECLDAYATTIQSTKHNLFIVVAGKNDNMSSAVYFPYLTDINNNNLYSIKGFSASEGLGQEEGHDPLEWICSGLPDKENSRCQSRVGEITNKPQTWSIAGGCSAYERHCDPYRWLVDHCLSERAEPRCRLYFSPIIAKIVTALNFCKFIIPVR